jgi:hypothetical protein
LDEAMSELTHGEKIHIRRSENATYDLEASLESYENTLKIVARSQYVIVI